MGFHYRTWPESNFFSGKSQVKSCFVAKFAHIQITLFSRKQHLFKKKIFS